MPTLAAVNTTPPPKRPQTIQPGGDLLNAVKAGFILQNTTFEQWCRSKGINRSNANVALLGGWRGPKAIKLIAKIKKAAGVT
jgi:hypothetical protein